MSTEERFCPPPIMIPCEGSGCPAIGWGICPMCGEEPDLVTADGRIVAHDRKDILAMIDRGDFG